MDAETLPVSKVVTQFDWGNLLFIGIVMARRLRSCAECPRCGTRYLVGFSPYGNGAYLESFITRFSKEYLLFCPCLDPLTSPRCSPSYLKRYAISRSAYDRGYGDPSEIRFAGGNEEGYRGRDEK
jgi:hypothetical protein